MLQKSIEKPEAVIVRLSLFTTWVSKIMILALMVLTCADVIGRYLGHPILGAFEISRYLAVVIIVFALAYTQTQKGHISIDLFFKRFPVRVRAIIGSFIYLISLLFFILVAWQSCEYARSLWLLGDTSPILGIPFFPIVYGIAFGVGMLCLTLLLELYNSIRGILSDES